jgi:hypothetical protein
VVQQAGAGPGVPSRGVLAGVAPRLDRRGHVLLFRLGQLVRRPLHHAQGHGQPGRRLRAQRSVRGLTLQGADGDDVDHRGHARPDLPGGAHPAPVPRRGRQRGDVVAGPVAGEQGVEHPGQRPDIGVAAAGRFRLGAVIGPAQGSVDAQPGDLQPAGRIPAQRTRRQPQVRAPRPVREGDGVGGIGDHGGGQGRVRQPGQHQVFQVRARRPFRHDVRAFEVEVGVVDRGQSRVDHLGRRLHGVDHGRRNRLAREQQVDRDGPAQQPVGGLPQRKPAGLER